MKLLKKSNFPGSGHFQVPDRHRGAVREPVRDCGDRTSRGQNPMRLLRSEECRGGIFLKNTLEKQLFHVILEKC